MKYIVRQTFESLGDEVEETFDSMDAAQSAAEKLRSGIAEMVSGWETPTRRPNQRTGIGAEIDAWDQAVKAAGVEFDEHGDATAGSPCKYGLAAGRIIAEAAVVIETEEDEA